MPLPTARATVLEEIRTIPDRENMGMPPQVKWTLTEYIRSGEWERAGSASVSHAVFKYADADGWIHLHRHKCRKNQILDQFCVGELAAMVLDQTEQGHFHKSGSGNGKDCRRIFIKHILPSVQRPYGEVYSRFPLLRKNYAIQYRKVSHAINFEVSYFPFCYLSKVRLGYFGTS